MLERLLSHGAVPVSNDGLPAETAKRIVEMLGL
jgi:hypothetical protein